MRADGTGLMTTELNPGPCVQACAVQKSREQGFGAPAGVEQRGGPAVLNTESKANRRPPHTGAPSPQTPAWWLPWQLLGQVGPGNSRELVECVLYQGHAPWPVYTFTLGRTWLVIFVNITRSEKPLLSTSLARGLSVLLSSSKTSFLFH